MSSRLGNLFRRLAAPLVLLGRALRAIARAAGRGLRWLMSAGWNLARAIGRAAARTPGWAYRTGTAFVTAAAGFIWRMYKRAYALALIVVLMWAGYMAVAYLVRSVFFPIHVPERFLQWQGRLDAASLRKEQVPGVTGPKPSRAPIGHYHGVDRWFRPLAARQPGSSSDCTMAGCHEPLPHTKIVAMRAFTNLHATFIACQTCHTPANKRPAPIVWVGLQLGGGQSGVKKAPAILRLNQFLQAEAERIKNDPRAAHGTIVELLGETIAVIGSDPVLEYLRLQIDTSEPGSPVWRHAVDQLATELPQHARGDYGARLAPDPNDPVVARANADLAAWTRAALAANAETAERAQLQAKIHAPLTLKPEGCRACHGDQPPLLDLHALGYSRERAEFLSHLPLADEVQRIREGQGEFRLPRLLEGGGAP